MKQGDLIQRSHGLHQNIFIERYYKNISEPYRYKKRRKQVSNAWCVLILKMAFEAKCTSS